MQSDALKTRLQALFQTSATAVSAPQRTLLVVMALIGALWGVPWVAAGASASAVFPVALQPVFHVIFGIGIVVTVGGDGVWLMRQMGQRLITPAHFFEKFSLRAFSLAAFFTLCSLIPPVYAAAEYNDGYYKLLSLIVLLVNMSYGLYGYLALIDRLSQQRRQRSTSRQVSPMQMAYQQVIQQVEQFLRHLSLNTLMQDEKQILEGIFQQALPWTHGRHMRWKKITQGACAALIPAGAFLVDIYLTRGFLSKIGLANPTTTMTLALVSSIPGFVVGVISTFEVAGRMIDFLGGRTPPLFKIFYPTMGGLIQGVLALVALTAPCAAAYITYTTLGAAAVFPAIQWGAVIAISLARFTFSNFTLNSIVSEFLLWRAHRRPSLQQAAIHYGKVIRLLGRHQE